MHQQDRHGRRCHARHARRLTSNRPPDSPEPLARFVGQARQLPVIEICRQYSGLVAPRALDLLVLALDVAAVASLRFDIATELRREPLILVLPARRTD